MIPYIEVSPWNLWGPVTVHPFGLLVAAGCVAGFFAARRHAGTYGLNRRHFVRLTTWTLVPAFLLSHWVALSLYQPRADLSHPFALLAVGEAMSSYGGFLGGAIGATFYLRRHQLPVLAYLDCLLLGLVVGWFFGRLGCSLVHDHPGRHTDFFLAVEFPDGPRHDLGFYEWLFTVGLLMVLFSLRRMRPPAGAMIGITCLLYAPVRFLLDFLRVGDTRYLGLTPGQYFSWVLLAAGITLLWHVYRTTAGEWRGHRAGAPSPGGLR